MNHKSLILLILLFSQITQPCSIAESCRPLPVRVHHIPVQKTPGMPVPIEIPQAVPLRSTIQKESSLTESISSFGSFITNPNLLIVPLIIQYVNESVELAAAENNVCQYWKRRGKLSYKTHLEQLPVRDLCKNPIDHAPCPYVDDVSGLRRSYTYSDKHQLDLISHAVPSIFLNPPAGTPPIVHVVIGGVIAINWVIEVGVPLLKGIKDSIRLAALKKKLEKTKGGGGGDDDNNDDDDDDKDKDKNKKDKKSTPGKDNDRSKWEHEENSNPKHHLNNKKNPKSNKNASRGIPKADQQKALMDSLDVPGKDYKVGVYKDSFAQFQQHAKNKFHSYIVDKFKDLPWEARNTLAKEGYVHCAKCGKIK
jgi:hypothetical protein